MSGSRTPRSTTRSIKTPHTKPPSTSSPASHSVRPTSYSKIHRANRSTSPTQSRSDAIKAPDKDPGPSRRRSSPRRPTTSSRSRPSRTRSSSRPISRTTPNIVLKARPRRTEHTSSHRRRRSPTPPSSSRNPTTRTTSATSRVEVHHNHEKFTNQEREQLGHLYERALRAPPRICLRDAPLSRSSTTSRPHQRTQLQVHGGPHCRHQPDHGEPPMVEYSSRTTSYPTSRQIVCTRTPISHALPLRFQRRGPTSLYAHSHPTRDPDSGPPQREGQPSKPALGPGPRHTTSRNTTTSIPTRRHKNPTTTTQRYSPSLLDPRDRRGWHLAHTT